jgi:hypothetical protein
MAALELWVLLDFWCTLARGPGTGETKHVGRQRAKDIILDLMAMIG